MITAEVVYWHPVEAEHTDLVVSRRDISSFRVVRYRRRAFDRERATSGAFGVLRAFAQRVTVPRETVPTGGRDFSLMWSVGAVFAMFTALTILK
jgi:hypothetical protein